MFALVSAQKVTERGTKVTAVAKVRVADLQEFDPARYLRTPDEVAGYLSSILEAGDPGLLAKALGDIARAKGMAQIADDAGMSREALYKALRPNAQPRLETVAKVCNALGLKLSIEALPAEGRKQTKSRRAASPGRGRGRLGEEIAAALG